MSNGAATTGSIRVNLFDGTRKPVPANFKSLIRILDGNKKEVRTGEFRGPSIRFPGLVFHDNFGDLYTVFVHAKDYRDAAVYPIHLVEDKLVDADLMLIPANGGFHFDKIDSIASSHPQIYALLTNGPGDAKERYTNAMEQKAQQLGALLNITAAIETIRLPNEQKPTPLYYDWQLEWDLLAPDRAWAWVDAQLVSAVRKAADLHIFSEEQRPEHFHPGIPGRIQPATASWKQTRFDFANVQLTFHERDRKTITFPDGNGGTRPIECVIAEPDIDYYKDLLAHGLLEVLPNWITHKKTNPEVAYMLRWMVARQEHVAEFNPPCTIEA